jgi:hypothetical protein
VPHPSSLDPSDLSTASYDGELLNAVQWHKHSNAYCLKCKKRKKKKANGTHRDNAASSAEEMNENCRFGYCKPCVNIYIVSIIETECKKKGSGEKQVVTRIELTTPHDDGWINSYMPHWRANMDVQLTIDLGKIVQYMAKYVTKAESTMTKGGAVLMKHVMKDKLANGLTVWAVLKKAMNKLAGEPMLQKQETCHQIAGNPTVRCSLPLSPSTCSRMPSSEFFLWRKHRSTMMSRGNHRTINVPGKCRSLKHTGVDTRNTCGYSKMSTVNCKVHSWMP